jgi:hypothetical protein
MMYLWVSYKKKYEHLFITSLKSLKKVVGSGAGSGSISQRYRSGVPDPDPHQNVTDTQHWIKEFKFSSIIISKWQFGWRFVWLVTFLFGDMSDLVHRHTDKDKILYLSLTSLLWIVEVRSAASFLSAQAQFRSQMTTDQSARPQQFSLLRKLRKCAYRNKLRTCPPLKKTVSDFPVPRRDVTYQTLPGWESFVSVSNQNIFAKNDRDKRRKSTFKGAS